MKKILILLKLILIPFSLMAQNTIEGSIYLITGKEYKTRLKGVKEWSTNTSDSRLQSGQRIKTDENTSLRILLNDRFIIFVSPDSDVNFTKLTDTEEVITVLKGDIILNAEGSTVKGTINTPTAEIIRDKPAEILLKVNAQDGSTELIVLKEQVLVKNLIQTDNNYKVVKQGEFSKILPQVLPTEPALFRAADIEDTIKRIKTPLNQMSISAIKGNPFDLFIEGFQFDSFFEDSKSKQSRCKDTYTPVSIPVDFEKNILSKETLLIINAK